MPTSGGAQSSQAAVHARIVEAIRDRYRRRGMACIALLALAGLGTPIALVSQRFRDANSVLIGAWVVIGILVVIVGVPASLWFRHPSRHPCAKRFKAWGEDGGTMAAFEQATRHLKTSCRSWPNAPLRRHWATPTSWRSDSALATHEYHTKIIKN